MAHGRTEGGLYYDAERTTMQKRDREMIPTRLVYAMFGLAALTLLFVSASVWMDRPLVGQPQAAPVVAERSFIFEKEGNAVRVTDPAGVVVADMENGGFISVVLDGLERARDVQRVQENAAVTITAFENGRLQLRDPSTGWQVELSSFGPGNRAAFVRLFNE